MLFPAEKMHFIHVTQASPLLAFVHKGQNREPLRQNEKSY